MKFVKIHDSSFVYYIPEDSLVDEEVVHVYGRYYLSYLVIDQQTGEVIKMRGDFDLEGAADKLFGIKED